jgi:predicted AAA+ superfamily ATPase
MRRNLFEPLLAHLDKKEFTILTGARQTGKSTLLRQLEIFFPY